MSSSPALYLGIDLGTSGCRGMLINAQQQLVTEASRPLASEFTAPHQHQQDAHQWWQAVTEIIQQLSSEADLQQLQAIAVDGTSGTVLLCDEHGQPLHDALMYNDARAVNQVAQIKQYTNDNSAVLAATSGLAKLLWLQQQDGYTDSRYFLHQADWITGKLLNRFGDSDSNNALKSGYDPVNRQWPTYFTRLGINTEWLPRVHQPGDILGNIDNALARQFNINPATRIIAGTTDSTAAIIATGVHQVGEAVTSLGSTLVMKVICDTPVNDTGSGVYSQPFGQYWLAGGGSNSGGAVLKHFFSDEQLVALSKQLQPQQLTGLDYYPLLSAGERFPVNDPGKRPVLEPRPDDDVEFLQGLLESMARIELQGYQCLQQLGAPYPTHVISCGGGANNAAWTKIRQHYLNVPVSTAPHQHAAYGMALLAQQGVTG